MIHLCQDKIIIKQYEQLLILEDNYIVIQTHCNMIKISGEKFIVEFFTGDEIHLNGKIKEVKFCDV